MHATLRSGRAAHPRQSDWACNDRAPMWGFALEIAYGLMCWRVYRGSRSLLAMIVLGNLANITLFSAAIPGPEHYLAGHPLMVVSMVAAQIVVTMVLIGVLATRRVPDVTSVRATRQPQMSRA
jgi:hypothetical protein